MNFVVADLKTFKMRTNKKGKQFYLNIISIRCDLNDTMRFELCDDCDFKLLLPNIFSNTTNKFKQSTS